MTLLQESLARVRHLFTRGIWQSEMLEDRSLRGLGCAILRVLSMTWGGIFENSLASRAGALSYSTMLGLGPLVALVVLFSSVVLERSDPNFAVNQLNRALVFIAPQVRHLQPVPSDRAAAPANAAPVASAPAAGAPSAAADAPAGELQVNPALVNLLNSFIQGSQSKAIGLMGGLALIIIVIQLFTSIENAFNGIWGVRRGRNWMLRIIFYWAAVTLGAVLVFSALTLLSASTFINMIESLPLGGELRRFFLFLGPAISVGVLAGVFTVFYKFIPNTTVRWQPALIGAVVVVLLMILNNYLAFLYLRNVVLSQSLYGSLGLLPILMLGLYVFWLFLLLGGQITYAVQNANYRSSQLAWSDLNHVARRGIGLLVFTLICRRFRDCRPAFSATQIGELIKIPTQILNACLGRLVSLGLVSRMPADEAKATQELRFQPARPLDRISVFEFKELFEEFGEGPTQDILDTLDPIVREFHRRLAETTREALGGDTFEKLIERLPVGVLAERAEAADAAATAPARA